MEIATHSPISDRHVELCSVSGRTRAEKLKQEIGGRPIGQEGFIDLLVYRGSRSSGFYRCLSRRPCKSAGCEQNENAKAFENTLAVKQLLK